MPEAPAASARAGDDDDAGLADWIAIGPAASLQRLAPLAAAHAARGRRVRRIAAEGALAIRDALVQASARLAPQGVGLLVVEPLDEPSIRTGWPCPVVPCLGAPAGFLRLDPPALATYAERAAALLARPCGGATPFALLGPREPRYLMQLDALAQGMRAPTPAGLMPLLWTAERLRKPALLNALRQGAACALYAGHGLREGWLAYGGLSVNDLHKERPWKPDESTAFLASLACRSGAPDGFADVAVAQGLAGAALAPMHDPLHADNRRLAEALTHALSEGPAALGVLIRRLAAEPLPIDGYVLIGDPGLAPRPSVRGPVDCARVAALAPDALVAAG